MKFTSILCALSAAFVIFAASAASAGHATGKTAAPAGAHYLNPQPLPP
jgi:hypothetical protein